MGREKEGMGGGVEEGGGGCIPLLFRCGHHSSSWNRCVSLLGAPRARQASHGSSWSHLTTLWPYTCLRRPRLHKEGPKWRRGSHNYYLCNLIQTLPGFRIFMSSLLISVKTFSSPALSSGPPDELSRGGSPPWCVSNIWFLVTSAVRGASS